MSDSESQFWEELEKNPELSKIKKETKQYPGEVVSNRNLDQITNSVVYTIRNPYNRERMQVLLQRVRDASLVQYQNSLSIEIQKLHKYYRKKISTVKQKNFKLMDELKNDFDGLKVQLNKKDIENERLKQIVFQQEDLITQFRIQKQIRIKLQKKTKTDQKPKLNKKENELYLQIKGLKHVIIQFQEQTEKTKNQLENLKIYIKKKEKEFQQTIAKLNQKKQKKQQNLSQQIVKLETNLKGIQQESETEIIVARHLSEKQTQLITTLQRELRSAKKVLNTPKLRYKFQQKVKNYSVDLRKYKKRQLSKYQDRGSKVWNPYVPRSEAISSRSTPIPIYPKTLN